MISALRLARRSLWALGVLLALPLGHAEARPSLAMEPFKGRKVRIDGSLGDWPAHLDALDVRIQGSGAEASALVGYDDANLYFALKTNSAAIVRKTKPGPGQDRATLEISIPGGRTQKAALHSIDFFPGVPGKMSGAVLVDGKVIKGAELVEFEKDKGFDLEARIPWSSIPGAAVVRIGLRGRITFFDATAPGKDDAAVATSNRGALVPLTSFAETGLLETLVSERGLRVAPAREAFGELTGGGTLERVALYDNILTIVGPDYRGGQEFFAVPLDVNSASQVRRLELFDFNRDGKDEIVLEKRISPSSTNYRQVVSVLEVSKDGVPSEIFLAEVALVTADGKVENEVSLSTKGAESALVIAQGKQNGFEPETFREPRLGEGIPSLLLPWDPVLSRRYVYRRGRLELGEEVPDPSRKAASRREQKATSKSASPRSTPARDAPSAASPSAASNMDRLYTVYKKSKGKGLGPIRKEYWQNVAEDERPERIVWQDRDLLVMGDAFQGGTKFAALTLPVQDASDILNVSLVEATGDGRLDIMVRAVLHAKTGDAEKPETIERQVVLLYSLDGGRIVPIFAVEVGRALGKREVLAEFQIVQDQGLPTIELRAGQARGFTKANYPFSDDSKSTSREGATIRPLLLPWSVQKVRRFAFASGEFREK